MRRLESDVIVTARIRRMGKVMFSVCSHLGGVPISHNALQHYPECHGAAGGYPGGGYPGRGVPSRVGTLTGEGYPGGYPAGGTLPGGTRGVPWQGGGGYARGVPCPGGVPS